MSYDIADDGRRRRIAEILEGYGQRVQWSVFECSLEDAVLEELRVRLRAELDGEEDSLRCYPLCPWCRERVMWQGRGAAATDWNYTIGHFDKLLSCNLSNRKAKSVVFALLHWSIT